MEEYCERESEVRDSKASLPIPTVCPEASYIPILTPGLLSAGDDVNLSPEAPSMIKVRPSQPMRKQRRPCWDSGKQDMEMDLWKSYSDDNRSIGSN